MALGSESMASMSQSLAGNTIYRLLAAADFGMLWSPNTALLVML